MQRYSPPSRRFMARRAGRRFYRRPGDLAALSTRAAEYIYGRAEPDLYAAYLGNSDRNKDMLAFLPGAYARATDDAMRARLANNWGNAYSALLQGEPAAEKYRVARTLSPSRSDMWWRVGEILSAHGPDRWRGGGLAGGQRHFRAA